MEKVLIVWMRKPIDWKNIRERSWTPLWECDDVEEARAHIEILKRISPQFQYGYKRRVTK